jgi:hypothetical protein
MFQRLLPERPTPERCVEAYYLQRTRFESMAERKLRWRQLTEDGNVGDQRAGLALLGRRAGRSRNRHQTAQYDPQRSLVRTRGLGPAVAG